MGSSKMEGKLNYLVKHTWVLIRVLPQVGDSTSQVFCFLKNFYVFNSCLLNVYSVPGLPLQDENTLINKTGKVIDFTEIIF